MKLCKSKIETEKKTTHESIKIVRREPSAQSIDRKYEQTATKRTVKKLHNILYFVWNPQQKKNRTNKTGSYRFGWMVHYKNKVQINRSIIIIWWVQLNFIFIFFFVFKLDMCTKCTMNNRSLTIFQFYFFCFQTVRLPS